MIELNVRVINVITAAHLMWPSASPFLHVRLISICSFPVNTFSWIFKCAITIIWIYFANLPATAILLVFCEYFSWVWLVSWDVWFRGFPAFWFPFKSNRMYLHNAFQNILIGEFLAKINCGTFFKILLAHSWKEVNERSALCRAWRSYLIN